MKKLDELKKDLMHGDNKLIASISGIPLNTVNAIMCGNRRLATPQGEKFILAANQLIEVRRKLLSSTSTDSSQLSFSTNAA